MAYVRPGMQRGYKFVPKFPLTKKVNVNGKDAHPIMIHLRVSNFRFLFPSAQKIMKLFIPFCIRL